MGDYNQSKKLLCFGVGDFVVDAVCGEVGLLMERYNLVDDDYDPIYAWSIMWSGYRYAHGGQPRNSPYTEESLKNMVIEGALIYYKNN